jgi:hypothetical protein
MFDGPNCKKLIIHIASLKAIPNGGSFKDGIAFFSNKDLIKKTFEDAKNEAIAHINSVKTIGDSIWQDDEAIAEEILKRIKNKKNEQHHRNDSKN